MKKAFFLLMASLPLFNIFGTEKPVSVLSFNGNFKDTVSTSGLDFDASAEAHYVKFVYDSTKESMVAELNGNPSSFIKLDNAMMDQKQMSLLLWFYPIEPGKWVNLISFGRDQSGTGYENYMFFTLMNSDSLPQLTVNAGGDAFPICRVSCDTNIIAGQKLETDTWHQVAITMDSIRVGLYIDGNLIGIKPFAHTPSIFEVEEAYIGKSLWPDPLFKGKVEDLVLYDRAITTEEVYESFTGHVGIQNPISQYRKPFVFVNQGSLAIDFKESDDIVEKIMIYNIQGQSVYAVENYVQGTEINLKSGIYIARVLKGNKLYTEKVYINQ